jgi:hypothetical protein
MDQETIQKIAAEIVRHLPSYPTWTLLVAQTVLMLIAAAAGTFTVEYLKTRGRNLATKADFEEVKRQLQITTEMVETIKTEVAQKDWARREWTNLRRMKLEEFLSQMEECELYLDRQRHKAFDGELLVERDPHPKFDSLATLYFPELLAQVKAFSSVYRNRFLANTKLTVDVQGAGQNLATRQAVGDQYLSDFPRASGELHDVMMELRASARKLIVEIMNVEHEHPFESQ